MSDRPRAVVFGSTGFIGSHVLEALRARGSFEVVALSHRTADLADPASLRACLVPGDIAINAAGYAEAADRSPGAEARFHATNVTGVENLAAAARDAGAAQLVHVSSVAAMGRLEGGPHAEGARGPVLSPYARSKRDAEGVLARYGSELAVTILRPTSVFGEGRALAAQLCRVASLPVVPLPGGGRALVPYTYVGNVAAAIALACGQPACYGGTYIVGDPTSYPLREIVLALARRMRHRARIASVPVPAARVLVMAAERLAASRRRPPLVDRVRLHTMTMSVAYTIDAFAAATGYVPPVTLDAAAERIVAWYRGTTGTGCGR